ncbi:MAG: 30S ribosomal protein S16 [Chlamydiota bacterium]
MALKIRLRQQGRRNRLTYRLVVVDSRSPRDGKYVEKLGYYDPHLKGNRDAHLFEDRIQFWLDRGAIFTEKAENIVKRLAPGVMKNMREQKLSQKQKRAEKRRKKASK